MWNLSNHVILHSKAKRDEEIGLKVRLRVQKSKVATILPTDKSSKGHPKGTTLWQDCEEASKEI